MITLKDYKFGIIGVSEVNIQWPLVNLADYWEDIISGHWETINLLLAWNLEDDANKVWRPVGYLQISMARTTHKVLSTGSDTSGLGHLIRTCYQGKHNLKFRVVTAYIPCTTNSSGVQTTYRQHQRYLDRTKYSRPPRQEMIEYLRTDISQWNKLGDHISWWLILMIRSQQTPWQR